MLKELDTAAESPAPPLFLNGVSGLGSPFWVADFESRFIGEGTAAERLLAVLESIVFLIRANLDELRPHGPALRRLVLTGGLSASDLFCQRLADVAALDVWRSREPEATARGLAWLTGAQPAGWSKPPGDSFTPRSVPVLERRWFAWLDAMPAIPGTVHLTAPTGGRVR